MRGFHLEFWVWMNDCPKCKYQIPCKSLQSRSCFLSNLLRISSLNSGRGKWCRLGQLLVFLANVVLHHLKSDTLASIKHCLRSVWGGLPWTSLMADPICFNSKSWEKHIAAFHLVFGILSSATFTVWHVQIQREMCKWVFKTFVSAGEKIKAPTTCWCWTSYCNLLRFTFV